MRCLRYPRSVFVFAARAAVEYPFWFCSSVSLLPLLPWFSLNTNVVVAGSRGGELRASGFGMCICASVENMREMLVDLLCFLAACRMCSLSALMANGGGGLSGLRGVFLSRGSWGHLAREVFAGPTAAVGQHRPVVPPDLFSLGVTSSIR